MGCGAKDVRMSNIKGSSGQRRKCVRMQKIVETMFEVRTDRGHTKSMKQKKNGKGKNQGHNLSDKGKMKHSNKDANRRCEIVSRETPITMFHDDAQQKRTSGISLLEEPSTAKSGGARY